MTGFGVWIEMNLVFVSKGMQYCLASRVEIEIDLPSVLG